MSQGFKPMKIYLFIGHWPRKMWIIRWFKQRIYKHSFLSIFSANLFPIFRKPFSPRKIEAPYARHKIEKNESNMYLSVNPQNT